jgi:hypothetical protein
VPLQGPPHDQLEAWTPGQSAAALEQARSGAEAVFCPTPEQDADPAELQTAGDRCDEVGCDGRLCVLSFLELT